MSSRRRSTGNPRVRIDAHVAGDDTEGSLRGERGEVLQDVALGSYSKNGKPHVSVRLEDGRIVGVPAAALRRD